MAERRAGALAGAASRSRSPASPGPAAATPAKPVGTVWIATAARGGARRGDAPAARAATAPRCASARSLARSSWCWRGSKRRRRRLADRTPAVASQRRPRARARSAVAAAGYAVNAMRAIGLVPTRAVCSASISTSRFSASHGSSGQSGCLQPLDQAVADVRRIEQVGERRLAQQRDGALEDALLGAPDARLAQRQRQRLAGARARP